MAARTLVPWLLGQPSHLTLVAESPEPRQGFAKNILGVQPVQEPSAGLLHIPACPQKDYAHVKISDSLCCGHGCFQARAVTAPRYFLQDHLSGQPSPASQYQ